MHSFTVIKGLHDSEKTQHLKDLYTFRRTKGMKDDVPVSTRCESMCEPINTRSARPWRNCFKVKVASVNTSREWQNQARPHPRGGRTSDWKKAVITLKEGEIELL